MRKRTKEVLFRMTDEEYIFFSKKVAESGLSKQKYLLAAALDKETTNGKELGALTELNKNMAKQLSAINQVITDLDGFLTFNEIYGELPDNEEIHSLIEQFKECRFEGVMLWELLRSYLVDQNQKLN